MKNEPKLFVGLPQTIYNHSFEIISYALDSTLRAI